MNSEESRLRSYSTWPISAPVSPQNLSANGFFATGNLFEVECNWCHCRISNWECSDDIEQRHIQLSPQCDFIINKPNCGNLPIIVTSNMLQQLHEYDAVATENNTSTTKEQSTLDLLIEKDRLATFVNWPNPNITPQSLAKAGFFYRNRSDEVECAWCKGVIAQWEKQDDAFEEHRRFFPECPRVLLGPLIEMANDGIRDLGIQQISAPKNPKYTSLHARLRTYSNWPIPDIQKPENLAQAGLYYQKVDDQVRCFHCNMGLRSWEKEDDPWFEHAKWYPMCDFVRLVKGANYIQEVQEITRTAQTSEAPITIEDAMKTEPVKHALEMGIDSNTLRNKTQQQISQTGCPYKTVEDLLKAVFDDQDNISSNSRNTIESSNANNYQSTSNIRQNEVLNPLYVSNNVASSNNSTISNENIKQERACNLTNTSLSTKDIKAETETLKTILETTEHANSLSRSNMNEKCTSDRKFLEEENRKLKDARLCKVCLDEEVGVVYLPCGHLVTCVQCAPGVNQCPMCRTTIKGFVRTYLS